MHFGQDVVLRLPATDPDVAYGATLLATRCVVQHRVSRYVFYGAGIGYGSTAGWGATVCGTDCGYGATSFLVQTFFPGTDVGYGGTTGKDAATALNHIKRLNYQARYEVQVLLC